MGNRSGTHDNLSAINDKTGGSASRRVKTDEERSEKRYEVHRGSKVR